MPGIDTPGVAQLSLLETALWPLDPSFTGPLWEPSYQFSRKKGAPRERAKVQIRAPFGLKQTDPYILWGLLGATLDRDTESTELVATPYWMLKYLGMQTGGSQYRQFADALERLAMTGYANRAFYNPLDQEYQRVAFSFFSSWLPTTDQEGTVDTDRSWRLQWDPQFLKLCRATGGSLLFDLAVMKPMKPMSRQLFLMLYSRFWRSTRVYMNIDELTIHGMGMSASRPMKKRKAALIDSIGELLDADIIRLGKGNTEPKDLVFRRSKGVFVATFYRGRYFDQPLSSHTRHRKTTSDRDELYEPLEKIGFNPRMIAKALREIKRGRIQQAIRITEIAMHEKPAGFPGFKKSPAAYCWNFMVNDYLPPDWAYQHEKEQRQLQWDREQEQANEAERELRKRYQKARNAALKAFLSGEGNNLYEQTYRRLVGQYRSLGGTTYQQRAADAAISHIEQQHFEYPEYAAWAMTHMEQF